MNALGFAKSLRQLGGVPSRVAGPFASYATKRLREQWARKATAYGEGWAPYAPASIRRGRGPLMVETGAMRAGTLARTMGKAGIALESGHTSILHFHMSGTRYMPARKTLPDAGLPSQWMAELKRLTVAEFRRTATGGR